MKNVLLHGFFFVLGIGYLILWQDQLGSLLHWRPVWILLIVVWGVLLACLAWWRHQRTRAALDSPRIRKPVTDYVKEGLPVVGLLVCLIGSAIEWESIVKGEGHFAVGLLWVASVAGMIALARRNLRVTVVTALRAFFGLLVIGAIAQQSISALVASGVIAFLLFLLEKFWKNKSVSPDQGEAKSLFRRVGEPPSPGKPH